MEERIAYRPARHTLSQETLLEEANKWEPEASQSPQSFRLAHCAHCGHALFFRMYHCWIQTGWFKKELHFHRRCYKKLLSLQNTTTDL